MFKGEINFDRFIRGLIFVASIVALCYVINYLSAVLVPFFVAWALAYLLYPIVGFFQHTCRLRYRLPSIVLTLVLVVGIIAGLLYMAVPVMINELIHLKDVAMAYLSGTLSSDSLPRGIQRFLRENADKINLEQLLGGDDLVSGVKNTVVRMWNGLLYTANVVISVLSSCIALLYLVFLLYDYEMITKKWLNFVPVSWRDFAKKVMGDIDRGMSGYFRGQALVALANCVMFSVGFVIIDFPMPVGLGVFIGIISFIPYVQLLGFVPATILAMLCALDTGRNFWMLMLGVIAVYIVVQILNDLVVTPHVMGKILGLRPAVVLLSLTVWGYMLGIIGLIIALPVTQLMITYYRTYVVGDPPENEKIRRVGAFFPDFVWPYRSEFILLHRKTREIR